MTTGDVALADPAGKIARILERRALGEAQMDLETDALGEHPENAKRRVAAQGIAADRLKSILERCERLQVEIKALQGDVKDILQEGASSGFNTRVIRKLLRIRAQKPEQAREEAELLELYQRALNGGEDAP